MDYSNCYYIKEESNYNKMIDYMFEEAHILGFVEKKDSFIVSILKRKTIQSLLGWLINPILRNKTGLYKFLKSIYDDSNTKYIIFLNSSFIKTKYPVSIMKYYKKKWPQFKFILLYIDVISQPVSYHANILKKANVFDLVYSVDMVDAEKYKMIFTRTPYSILPNYMNILSTKDLYFCGVTKDRGTQLIKIIDRATQNGINISMDIFCSESEQQEFAERDSVNVISDYVSYERLLKETLKSRCILDLVQSGQSALTLRPYEAVVYNRKLLTNNKSIFDFEFYNPDYMQYFASVEDIDWEWVKKPVEVFYDYKGEFSPVKFIEIMQRSFN